MKGTSSRGENINEDNILVENLLNDEKIKAENLMIVDLLRNDLGMIAKNGSVKVQNLLELETHSTLHQITSTVFAELENAEYNFFNIFKALFPCGSVTGAPKIETMKFKNRTKFYEELKLALDRKFFSIGQVSKMDLIVEESDIPLGAATEICDLLDIPRRGNRAVIKAVLEQYTEVEP